MITIEIKIDNRTLIAALQGLQDMGTDSTALMRQCAGIMAGAVEDAFAGQRDPVTGTPWVPLQQSTVLARQLEGHDGKILQLSGSMASTIARRYGNGYAVVGSNKKYAAIHQFGGKTRPHTIRAKFAKALKIPGVGLRKSVQHPGSTIPARPFLGIGPAEMEEIHAALTKAMQEALS